MKHLFYLLIVFLCCLLIPDKVIAQHQCCSHPSHWTNFQNPSNDVSEYGLYAYDRFGIRYPLEDLVVDLSGPRSCPDYITSDGMFQLVYVDTSEFCTNPAARATVQQVFEDLENLLIRPSHACSSPVIIKIGSYNEHDNTLGWGSSHYIPANPIYGNGILYGEVWKAINTGTGSSSFFNGSYFHGQMGVNFHNSINWRYDSTAATTNIVTIPTNEDYMYAVVLHEALHILGFASLIIENGNSYFTGMYSRFDLFMRYNTTIPFITDNGNYYYAFNMAANTKGGSGSTTFEYDANTSYDLYSPTYWNEGSSLSHFDSITPMPYAMKPYQASGQVIHSPHVDEIEILNLLGYSTTGIYGNNTITTPDTTNQTTFPIAQHDGVGDQSCFPITYFTDICDTTSPKLITPTLNDDNVTFIDHTLVTVLQGTGNVTQGTNNTNFHYKPSTAGVHLLKYIPQNGNTLGNFGLVTIIATGCGGLGCDYATSGADPCNLVCNGDFTNISGTCGTPDCSSTSGKEVGDISQSAITACPLLAGWEPLAYTVFTPTPDYIEVPSNCSAFSCPNDFVKDHPSPFNSDYIRLGGDFNFSEVIAASVNVTQGESYILSYHESRKCNETANISIISGFSNSGQSLNILNGQVGQPISSTLNWTESLIYFTNVSNNFDRLFFAVTSTSSNFGIQAFFDNISLIKDDFTAGADKSTTCINPIQIGQNFCGIDGTVYKWYEADAIGNKLNNTVLNSNTSVSYMTVNPSQTTYYRLERSHPSTTVIDAFDFMKVTVINPVVNNGFTYSINGNQVQFTSNNNTNFTHTWDFGNGMTSQAINPTVAYTSSGTYTVILTVSNYCGQAISTQNITVTVCSLSGISSFNYIPNSCNSSDVTFINPYPIGTPITWNFGNGQTSTLDTVTVTYANTGPHTVSITATECGAQQPPIVQTITLDNSGISGFTHNQLNCNVGSYEVEFTSGYPTGTTVSWNFGDGQTSNAINPTVFYASAGTYTVILVGNPTCGQQTFTQTITVSDNGAISGFTVNQLTCNPNSYQVEFINDYPTGTTVLWDFGNGQTSNAINPTITYTSIDTYNVTLTASLPCGQQIITQPVVISNTGVIPDFTYNQLTCNNNPNSYQVQFINSGYAAGTPVTWNFGGGVTSNLLNPLMTFTNAGTISVTLDAEPPCGQQSTTQNVTISNIGMVNDFDVTQLTCNTNGYAMQFSSNYPTGTSVMWDFGGGITSTSEDTTVIFSSTNTVQVSLTATLSCGTQIITQSVTPSNTGMIGNFTYNQITCNDTSFEVQFTSNYPQGTTVFWDFGNGITSYAVDTTIIFSSAGSYVVTLVGHPSCGEQTTTQTISVSDTGMIQNFTYNQITCNVGSYEIDFTSNYASGTTVSWDFDNGNTSSIINPTEFYTSPGVYNVALTANPQCGLQTITQPVTVSNAGVSSGILPTVQLVCNTGAHEVQFISGYNNPNISLTWDFGPNATPQFSNALADTITFSNVGPHNITLVANPQCGQQTLTQEVILPSHPEFTFEQLTCEDGNYQATFTSPYAPGIPVTWNFGQNALPGYNANAQNPTVTFDNAGPHTVTLSATLACGTEVQSQNVSLTAADFPYVDYSQTGWATSFREQGYDVTTDADGNIYAVGMKYNSFIIPNQSHIIVYKLDVCGKLIWKSIFDYGVFANNIHSGKILVANGKVYFGVSNTVQNFSRVYRIKATDGDDLPYSNGNIFVQVDGRMTDFDLDPANEILFIASLDPANLVGYIQRFDDNPSSTTAFAWRGRLVPPPVPFYMERLELSLNHDDSRLYVGFTVGHPTNNGKPNFINYWDGNGGQNAIYFPEISGVYYIDATSNFGDFPASTQTPHVDFSNKISDLEVIEDNTVSGGTDYIYFTNNNRIRLLDGNLDLLNEAKGSSIKLIRDNSNYLYYDENDNLLYVAGKDNYNGETMTIEVYDPMLNFLWDIKQSISTSLPTTPPFNGANTPPTANGIATDAEGRIFVTGSVNTQSSFPNEIIIGNKSVITTDHSEVFIARILVDNNGSPYFGRVTNNTTEIESEVIIERLETTTNNQQTVLIRPNPTTNTFELVVTTLPVNNANITLFDIHGRLLQSIYQGKLEGNTTFNVDVANHAAGIYIVRLNLDGKITTKKVVIIR